MKHLFSTSGDGERFCDLCEQFVKDSDTECKVLTPCRSFTNEGDYNYLKRMAIYDKLDAEGYKYTPR